MILSVELTPDQLVVLAREVARELRAFNAAPAPAPEVYTADQVAAILGVCEKTIRRRVAAGVIGKVPEMGSTIRIPRAEVERMTMFAEKL
jgi:excisionase family DNA binding protein